MSVSSITAGGEQASIIYGFDGGNEIRELYRAGRGEILERESTKSNLSDRLPELPIPGTDGLQQPDCGEDIPAFACSDCGHPVYVGRTCGSPSCERCWQSAIKDKVTRLAGKLEGFRRKLYASHDGRKNIDFNHVVASLPEFVVDSTNPTERALKVLKTILENNWFIEGFTAVYHPYRIKQEYRADQYEHGGESGEGDMTWKDVLNADEPNEYTKFEPHFHLFFAAPRASFDYSVAEAVEDEAGWLFHRVTKGAESNVSVEDLDDLVHQLTYCLSHAGVNEWHADRAELTTRMKGDLHNCYAPEDVEDDVLASFCSAAPRLLGARFSNLSEATCSAELPKDDDAESTEVWESELGVNVSSPRTSQSAPIAGGDGGGGSTSTDTATDAATEVDSVVDTKPSKPSTIDFESIDDACGGELKPMSKAKELLDDPGWCDAAPYADSLRQAANEWEDIDEGGKPWSGSANEDVIHGG